MKYISSFFLFLFTLMPLSFKGMDVTHPEMPKDTLALVSWYEHLSEPEKDTLRKEIDSNDQTKSHPLMCGQSMQLLTHYAQQLLEQHPHDRIFCLGQSLAYLTQTAHIIQILERKSMPSHTNNAPVRTKSTATFTFIPFSGYFFAAEKDPMAPGSIIFKKKEKDFPSEHKIKSYRAYLASIGFFSPRTIIDEYVQNKKYSVIVEYTQSGKGLFSFLSIIRDWAQEEGLSQELHQALKLYVLTCQKQLPIGLVFSLTQYQFDYSIFEITDNDFANDRLVMNFQFYRWDSDDPEENPHNFHPSRNAQLLRFHIVDYVTNNNPVESL
jgi:hypothetical protein